MSFATLAECSAISKLEITKNPFDSDMELNLPALSSPSIFTKQETPASQKKGFRWSIDQISKLDPADIEEFPNQEYSSTYERPEDESKAQEAINEYFSHGTILPSPWTPENHVKHVTFSPLPPTTAYISGDEDSMTDVSNNSSNSASRRQLTDVCCQTSLTFPPSFDLANIVDCGYYSYVEDDGSNDKLLNLSSQSLRRKLFSQDECDSPMKTVDQKSPLERITRSILKSQSPKNVLTSSPKRDRNSLHPDNDSPFLRNSKNSPSPQISPIKSSRAIEQYSLEDEFASQYDATISNDDVFTSNILESSDVCINPSLFPDVSPIKDHKTADQRNNVSEDEQNDVDCDKPKTNLPSDGGPMKLSDLSDVIMDYDNNEESILNESKMDMTSDIQQLTKMSEDQLCKLPRIAERDDAINHASDDIINGEKRHDVNGDDVILKHGDDVIYNTVDDVIVRNNDDVIFGHDNDVVSRRKNDVIFRAGEEVIFRKNDDVDYRNDGKVRTGDDLISGDDVISSKTAGFSRPVILGSDNDESFVRMKDMDEERHTRQRGVHKDTQESRKENVATTCLDNSSRILDDKNDEELIKRASAAMRRAERLVQETCMEQGTGAAQKSGTSATYLNWSRVDRASLWHPIDMSTPVVHDKMKKPQTLDTAGASSLRRHLSDRSYNNLLSSFANSRLDQVAPRSYSGHAQDSGMGTIGSSQNHTKSRGRSLGLETKRRRSLADIRTSGSLNSPRDAYLSGRYGYNRTSGNRYSWPPWKSSRSRYFNGRSISPTIPSGKSSRQHYNKVDGKLRHVDNGLGEFAKPLDPSTGQYLDYFDGMHSTSRKSYCR